MYLGGQRRASGCPLVIALIVTSGRKLATTTQHINETEDVPRDAMQSRSLQDGARSNIHVPRCPTSYFDTTGGKAYWWACGASCQGAFYTDGNCECACKRSTAAPTMTTRTPRRVTARPTMEAPRTPTTRLRQAVLPVDSLEPVRSRVGNAPVGQAFSHHPSNFTAVESKPALVVSLEETRADSQNGVVLAVICVVVLFLVAISVIFYGMLCMMDRNNSLQTPPKVHVSPPSHVPVMLKFQTAPVPALQIWKPSEGQLVQIRGQGLLHVNALQAHAGDPASKSAQSSSRTSDTRTPSAWSTTASECFHGNAPSVGSEVQTREIFTLRDAGVLHKADACTVSAINPWVLPHQPEHLEHA